MANEREQKPFWQRPSSLHPTMLRKQAAIDSASTKRNLQRLNFGAQARAIDVKRLTRFRRDNNSLFGYRYLDFTARPKFRRVEIDQLRRAIESNKSLQAMGLHHTINLQRPAHERLQAIRNIAHDAEQNYGTGMTIDRMRPSSAYYRRQITLQQAHPGIAHHEAQHMRQLAYRPQPLSSKQIRQYLLDAFLSDDKSGKRVRAPLRQRELGRTLHRIMKDVWQKKHTNYANFILEKEIDANGAQFLADTAAHGRSFAEHNHNVYGLITYLNAHAPKEARRLGAFEQSRTARRWAKAFPVKGLTRLLRRGK